LNEKIKIGTCAWSYDDWRGSFYPARLPQNRWLEFYARHFSAVEVDSTFYHTPTAHAVAHWLDVTPDDFSFSCKMPRAITHESRLRDCEEKTDAFLEAVAPLRAKLGCVLVQLPPHFTLQRDESALKHFVMRLPRDIRFAIEFRSADWHTPRITHLLEQNRICWAWTDVTPLAEQNRAAFEILPQTTDFIYLRLLGDLGTKYHADGSRIHRYGSLMWPRDSSIESWAIKIEKHLAASSSVRIFSGNHFEGSAPLTAQRVAKQLGLKIELPAGDELKKPDEAENPQLDLL
jgi:uncharacterized protein YecE (DUF72 family)